MSKHYSVRTTLLFGVGLAGLAALSSPALASTITVNAIADSVDSSGDCSLREAVMAANTDSAVDGCTAGESAGDTIVLPAGTYTLGILGADETWETSSGSEPYVAIDVPDASIGDLDLTGTVTLVGAGSDATFVQWNLADADRIFHIAAPAEATIAVTLEGLTVQGGSVASEIMNEEDPVEQQWIFRRFGGAIAMGSGAGVKLTGASGSSDDGGPSDEELATFGTASLAMSDVQVRDSYAGGDAGGLFSAGAITMEHVWFEANLTDGNAGAWYQEGAFSVTDAVFLDNEAEGGGAIFASGPTSGSIERALIQGNYATGGGGISVRSLVEMTIRDTFVIGNEAFDVGGGLYGNGSMEIYGCTFVANLAGGDADFGGGAINAFGGGQFGVANSVFADNLSGTNPDACGCTGGSCSVGSFITSMGHNIEDSDSCEFGDTSDLPNADPMLSAQGDFGGYFDVFALTIDSVAVDGGDDALCSTTDARGVSRPLDADGDTTAACDIGAFELSPDEIDTDGDGFCTGIEIEGTLYCADGSLPGDCDDTIDSMFPGNAEVCDGLDNDCNDLTDDGLVFQSWYLDVDSDSFGDAEASVSTCDGAPFGYVDNALDCDDGEAAVNPSASEVCNGALDDDCDGLADDADPDVDLTTGNMWYLDADGDTYGDVDAPLATCLDLPIDYADDATDCDDTDAAVNPGAAEVCNEELDDNCDGVADDNDANLDLSTADTWYLDADGDTFGDPAVSVQTCAGAPADHVADGTDCDDAQVLSFPGNAEVCDGLDNDCNLEADDGLTFEDWYLDADGDGYGDPDTLVSTCDGAPADHASDGTDCDDGAAAVNPGEVEVFDNERDDNCDGLADKDDPTFEGCGGCSSGAAQTPMAWLGLVGLVGLTVRRRR